MSLHLGIRLAAPKHCGVHFNSKVLQLHIPTDTASTVVNPPTPTYFLKKKNWIQSNLCVTPADTPLCLLHSSFPWHRWLWLQRCLAAAQFQLCPPQLALGHWLQNRCNVCIFRAPCSNSNWLSLFSKQSKELNHKLPRQASTQLNQVLCFTKTRKEEISK